MSRGAPRSRRSSRSSRCSRRPSPAPRRLPSTREAYLVQNAATGEVLAAHDARERVPIASDHEADDRARRARARAASTTSSRSRARAAGVGESTINLRRRASGSRVRRPVERGADPERERRGVRARRARRRRRSSGFVALMNAKARALGLTDTHFVNPDGLDAPGHVSSARDVTSSPASRCSNPFIRATVRRATRRRGRPAAAHLERPALDLPRPDRREDGHTDAAGWSQVAAARRRGVTIYATLLGGRDARRAERRPRRAARRGASTRYRTVSRDRRRPRLRARRRTAYGRPPVRLVAAKPAAARRARRAAARRARGRSRSGGRCRSRRASGSARCRCSTRGVARRQLAARRRPLRSRPGRARASTGWYAGRDRCTTSGGCFRDRHRHPQRRARPHADRPELPARAPPPRERGAHARRRQGHQRRARAEAARRPRRRDRPRRRPHRARGSSRS